MSKQEKLISAEKILSDMKQRVQGLLRSKDANYDVFPVVNALDNYINRIESGVYDADPVPTIKLGDKHRCPYCNIASTQQDWDETTDKKYDGDTTTIHDCKTLNLLAYFVCPSCGEEAELDQMEVVKDE